jgi:CheY-like chemotaxis protein
MRQYRRVFQEGCAFPFPAKAGEVLHEFFIARYMKVMIVDDNAEMRGFIRTLLGEVADEFVECADGREAVAVYEAERPDWAVMDVMMGAIDGVTATRLITSRFPESRIMIVTQHNNPKLRDRAREAGAAGFLLKEDLLELRSALTAPREPKPEVQS